jgi:glycosyltransferase involved in cell wall biosynthesis
VKPGRPLFVRWGSDVRVLYLNPFSQEVSGPDESLRTLLAVLVRRGLEPHLVLPAPGPQVERYQRLGVQVHFLPLAPLRRTVSLQTFAYPAQLLWAAGAVAALARRIRADLIHTNMEVLLEGGIAARLIGRPHVLHYRGNTLDQPKWVFDALVALWVQTSDWIFCISEATADIFRRRGRGQSVQALHNPLDLATFAPRPPSATVRRELGAGEAHKLVGTVGRIHPRKDLETFIRAAARVSRAEPLARFAIVGAAEGPAEESYRAQLAGLARELGVAEQLTFAGARRDIPDVMRAVDVFVLTSRHEGFGRVVAEAMAAGRPSVVTDEGAPPALVGHGRYGLCAAPGDDKAFAAQIQSLLDAPEAAAARGVDAVAAARQFDAEAVADQVWSRYRVLVERA